MRLLLDTHILLWALIDPVRLPPSTRTLLQSSGDNVFFSAASIWEVAIKSQLARATFRLDANTLAIEAAAAGFIELPVRSSAAAMVASLPMHHRDPFDRVLVAQAMHEPARLLTSDRFLARYSELVTLV